MDTLSQARQLRFFLFQQARLFWGVSVSSATPLTKEISSELESSQKTSLLTLSLISIFLVIENKQINLIILPKLTEYVRIFWNRKSR